MKKRFNCNLGRIATRRKQRGRERERIVLCSCHNNSSDDDTNYSLFSSKIATSILISAASTFTLALAIKLATTTTITCSPVSSLISLRVWPVVEGRGPGKRGSDATSDNSSPPLTMSRAVPTSVCIRPIDPQVYPELPVHLSTAFYWWVVCTIADSELEPRGSIRLSCTLRAVRFFSAPASLACT